MHMQAYVEPCLKQQLIHILMNVFMTNMQSINNVQESK